MQQINNGLKEYYNIIRDCDDENCNSNDDTIADVNNE